MLLQLCLDCKCTVTVDSSICGIIQFYCLHQQCEYEYTGGKVSRDAGPVKGGKTVIAFVEDPTGYKWELITREEPIKEPIAQVNSYSNDDSTDSWCIRCTSRSRVCLHVCALHNSQGVAHRCITADR